MVAQAREDSENWTRYGTIWEHFKLPTSKLTQADIPSTRS